HLRGPAPVPDHGPARIDVRGPPVGAAGGGRAGKRGDPRQPVGGLRIPAACPAARPGGENSAAAGARGLAYAAEGEGRAGGRWPVVATALPWLLEKYPEFRTVPAGYARVAGQAAFASAASGAKSDAWRWVGRTLSANPREPRAYIALGVMSGLVSPDAVVRW